ncbi:MAG: hypothetical protein ACLS6G_08350 [Christensenellales bacterium]
MSTEKMQASFRLLMLITTPKLAEKALLLFEKGRLPMQIQAYAHGTASREMMDMLGLDSGEKSLLLTMMPRQMRTICWFTCAGSSAGALRQRHCVHRADVRREQACAADGSAALREKPRAE